MPFAPKEPVDLDPPKDDTFTTEQLAQYDGVQKPEIYLAVKGVVFDVTKNRASYGPEGGYRVFVAKDASRALAKSSLKPEDAVSDTQGLTEKEQKVLDDWYSFYSQRYNIMGKVKD
uniref:ARAD1A19668p n=1 Tax=Blastobotrys adeninivorans TaxID=409370 RepID=A0A060SZD1_BLAAD